MKLKEWREDSGRTVASVVDELGCTRQAVSKWEAGSLPHPDYLASIVRMTGGLVTPNDWLDFHELAPAMTGSPPKSGYAIEWKPDFIMRSLQPAPA